MCQKVPRDVQALYVNVGGSAEFVTYDAVVMCDQYDLQAPPVVANVAGMSHVHTGNLPPICCFRIDYFVSRLSSSRSSCTTASIASTRN